MQATQADRSIVIGNLLRLRYSPDKMFFIDSIGFIRLPPFYFVDSILI
jgi:hypothetical protein